MSFAQRIASLSIKQFGPFQEGAYTLFAELLQASLPGTDTPQPAPEAAEAPAVTPVVAEEAAPEQPKECAAAAPEVQAGCPEETMKEEAVPAEEPERAPAEAPVTAQEAPAPDAGAEQEAAAVDYAEALGLAFQIRDDMLDVLSTAEELGKPIGSDAQEGKTTFMSLYGAEECEKRILVLTEQAKQAARRFDDSEFLTALADSMAVRRS